ncbi:MAG: hypothetical protein ACTSPN_00845 [Promethearchaeota archaeon]
MDTWSYRILECDDSYDLYYDITEFVLSRVSDEEFKSYPRRKILEERYKELIDFVYEDLKQFIESMKSRLAYMILGMYLMMKGAQIDDELKQQILKYSDWKYEKDQINNERHRIQRKNNLDEFRENLKKYDGKEKIPLQFDTITSVLNRKFEESDGSPVKLKNIDYSIKGSINI